MEELRRVLAPEVPTIDKYRTFVKQNNEPEVTQCLPGDGIVGWFGSRTASRVFGYIPGGGLSQNASPMQIGMAYDVYKQAKRVNDDVALAVLSYTVCTVKPYPAQVDQAVRFIELLLSGRKAEEVHLFGESAGGTLILASLLHVRHPHPKVQQGCFPAGQKLGQILLLSPSAPVYTAAESFKINNDKDVVNTQAIQHLWSLIEANHEEGVELVNPWLTPALTLEETWYKELPVGEITIVWGENEVLRDDIARVAGIIKQNHGSAVDLLAVPGVGHCPFAMERLMNLPESEYSLAINRWASAVV